MFEVEGWTGKVSPYDKRRFAKWLTRNLEMQKSHARFVSNALETTFEKKTVVQPQQLVVAASRIGIASLATVRLGGDINPAMLPISPGDALSAASGVVKFLAGLYKEGWKKEPGKGWVKEEGSFVLFFDDAKAPTFQDISQVGSASCCRGDPPAVRLKIKVTVSDDGGAGNDSGVKKVKLFGVTDRGVRGALRGSSYWKLSKKENDKTQSGDVSHVFDICVPCSMIKNKNADIWFEAEDDDENCRITRLAFSVGGVFDRCCRGA